MSRASLRRVALAFIITAVTAWLTTLAPSPASATTGPTQFLPDSRYKVASKVAQQYTGEYVFKSAAPAARLKGGALAIEVDNKVQLVGVAQFYGYDNNGQQTAWVGTLYNFHLTGKHVMIADIVGPTGQPLLARLFLTRSSKGDLIGQIELPEGRFAITWQKLPKH
jgi:hypothetical protein